MTQIELNHEALNRAKSNTSTANYTAIIEGFGERGIKDIRPRENVLTYRAWQAQGRQVRKGEKGVKVTTWIPMGKEDDKGKRALRPKTTTVFHIDQTDGKV